jgi:outer membrane immunogenic protein
MEYVMTRTGFLAATVLSFATIPAFAADPAPGAETPVIAAPAPVAAPFWEGGYVGGQLGYSYGEFDIDTGQSVSDFDDDNVIGGLHAGYLWSVGNGWYVGPEFQYDFADVTVTDAASGDTASFDEIARLKAVAGREIGNGLLYGSAGIAYASFDSVGNVFDGFDGSDTNFVVGVGYDYRVGENWTVGGEYQYHSFSGIGANGGDVDVNTLHLKASYRF